MFRVGIDIVKISDFEKRAQRSGLFLGRIFDKKELSDREKDLSHLAGLFAAKEAVLKALSLPAGCWREIVILHEKSGRPVVESKLLQDYKDFDLSISHDGDYAVAMFVAITD